MITTLEEFICEFQKIKAQGWIQTHRSGPTGVGKTLEDLLGIPENNHGEPDFGEYELKSCRLNSPSMLTMFTKAPQPARSNTYLRLKYGYASDAYDNDGKVLHSTLTAARLVPIADTGRQLKIVCDSAKIAIASETEIEDVFWSREALRNAFNKKFKNKFVYVKADSRGHGAREEFLYQEAYKVSGFGYDALIALLEQGKIFVDLRIGQFPNGKTHDHGTAFRIREADQYLLFKNINRIV